MADISILARLRRACSASEAAGLALLSGLALAGIVLAAFGAWTLVAALGFALLVAVGAMALFAARRSRLAAQQVSSDLDAQSRLLIREVPRRGATGNSGSDDAGRPGERVADSGVLANYVDLGATMPDHRWLDNTILRNASVNGRDLLAWGASDGRATYDEIARHMLLARMPETRARALNYVARLDPEWALRIARVVALQDIHADDRFNALTLYRCLYELHGPKAIRPPHSHARVFQALAFHLGDFELAQEIVRRVRCTGSDLLAMRADLLNPFTSSPYADADAWLEQFNRNFESTGLEPVRLERGDGEAPGEPFDWLRCEATSSREDGPLVTVVVSAWKPGHGLVTAVQSLLVQSHRNIEILVVDDCSPDEFLPVLEQVAALDARIRVLRQPVNGGTYAARNRALDEARGEFMTFLDSDDWSHPRRIEMQVDALVENSRLIYTTTRSLRTDPRLVFNLPGVVAQRENASSLMFRIGPVRERVGYFDRVRKGADTEFALRLRRIFGIGCYRILEHNLGMIRLTTGSLSREEFKAGWRHPSRAAYRRSYEHWHRSASGRLQRLKTSNHEDSKTFCAPLRFLMTKHGEEVQRRSRFDLAFVADLRHGEATVRALLDEARACQRAGLRVGVIHVESFRYLERAEMQPFWGPLHDAIAERELDEVLLTDAVSIGTVLVRDPEVLQFASSEPCALDVGQVLVLAPVPSVDADGRRWFDPSTCHHNAQAHFGARCAWIPLTPESRDDLRQALPHTSILDVELPMVVSSRGAGLERGRRTDRSVVVGRIVDAGSHGLPEARDVLRACYPLKSGFQVRMMGHRGAIESALGSHVLPWNWSFHESKELSHEAFLQSCDFYVYFTGHTVAPRSSRDVLEAMAAGCVVIASPDLAGVYGDAAVYCEPREVVGTMTRLHEDAAAAAAQREAGLAHVAQHVSGAAFVEALRPLMARD